MDTQTTALVPAAPASSSNMDLRAYCDHASKMRESSDIAQIAAALVRAQAALDSPPRNREVLVRTKTGSSYTFRYATLDKIMETIRAALGGNGLCVLQPIVSTQRGPVLVTRLLHESGQWMECEIPLPTLGDSLQDFGSAVSYVRRYAVSAMLNITADEDDDGNTAAGNHVADAPRRDDGRRGPARSAPDNGRAGTAARAGRQEPAPRRDQATPGNDRPDDTARRDQADPPRGTVPRGSNDATPTHTPSQAPQPAPAKSRGDLREADAIRQDGEAAAPPASPNKPDAAPAKAASAPRQAPDAPRRHKDEAAPPSAWRILRPGKADITAPDGTKWLKWWTDRAAKAQAENRRDELRALQDANAAAWDAIALASPETEAVMAQAAQAVRAVLDA